VEPYLHRCLDSLVNQTLKDIEIICINDCSSDNSLAILKEYAEKDDRIKIIDFEKNQGVGKARNRGMEIAKGEYFGFCDSDDYVDLDFYEKLYDKAKKTEADMAKSSLKMKKIDWVKEYSYITRIRSSKYDDISIHWCYIYKASLLKVCKISYLEGVKFGEDAFFLIKSLFYSKKIEIVDDVFYHYILRKDGAATSSFGDVLINSFGFSLICDFINETVLDKNEYEDFFCKVFMSFLFGLFSFVIPEYRKTFINILVDNYKNRKHPVSFKNLPKFLEESDFENADILFEKMGIFSQYPEIKIDDLQNRKLYIWGAGSDGREALAQCDSNGWKVENFLDSSQQVKEFNGYKVLQPQYLLDSKNRDFFIVISSRIYACEIAEICERAGLKEGKDFFFFF
jgi:glycosyltransferase involved in cell wall biosynthesis